MRSASAILLLPGIVLLASCRTTPKAPGLSPLTDPYGMRVYLPEGQDIPTYLRKTRVLVSRFRLAEERAGGRQDADVAGGAAVVLLYPSTNEAGRSPMFSHAATVRVAAGVPLRVQAIAPGSTMLVLTPTAERAVYELIGTAPPDESFDWFGDKPEYHHAGDHRWPMGSTAVESHGPEACATWRRSGAAGCAVTLHEPPGR